MGLYAFQQTGAILGIYYSRGVLPAFKKVPTSALREEIECYLFLIKKCSWLVSPGLYPLL